MRRLLARWRRPRVVCRRHVPEPITAKLRLCLSCGLVE